MFLPTSPGSHHAFQLQPWQNSISYTASALAIHGLQPSHHLLPSKQATMQSSHTPLQPPLHVLVNHHAFHLQRTSTCHHHFPLSLSLSLPLMPTSFMNVTTILHPQRLSTTSNALPCTSAHLHSNPVARSHHHLHHPISSIVVVPHHLTLKGAMRHPPMHLQTHIAVTVTPTNIPLATVSATKYL